jgi:hypothetical protein
MDRVLPWIFGLVVLILLAAFVILGYGIANSPYLAHPLGLCAGTNLQIKDCKGYNFWSGIGSDIGEFTIVGGLLTIVLGFWHQHNCHYTGCPWLCWHADPETGHPVCKKHHPDPHGYLTGKNA